MRASYVQFWRETGGLFSSTVKPRLKLFDPTTFFGSYLKNTLLHFLVLRPTIFSSMLPSEASKIQSIQPSGKQSHFVSLSLFLNRFLHPFLKLETLIYHHSPQPFLDEGCLDRLAINFVIRCSYKLLMLNSFQRFWSVILRYDCFDR
ncbi:hypothetical protein Hanom_Chr07g00663211 [Helianthus anomalus]